VKRELNGCKWMRVVVVYTTAPACLANLTDRVAVAPGAG
jgi:hypothetical protein